MADRDFASYEAPAKPSVRESRLRSVVVVAGLLIVVTMAFATGFWLGKEHGAEIAESADKAKLLVQIRNQQDEIKRLKARMQQKDAELHSSRIGDLTFYNELPRQNVMPAPLTDSEQSGQETPSAAPTAGGRDRSEAVNKKEPTDQASRNHYWLQTASFRNRDEARALLGKIEALGLSGRVKAVQLPGRGVWFRVLTGPYPSKREAVGDQKKIRETLKLEGLIIHADG